MKKTAILLTLSLLCTFILCGCQDSEINGTYSLEVEDGYAIYIFDGKHVTREYQPKTDDFSPMSIKGKFKYDDKARTLTLDFTGATQAEWSDFYMGKRQVLTYPCTFDGSSLSFDGYTYTKSN